MSCLYILKGLINMVKIKLSNSATHKNLLSCGFKTNNSRIYSLMKYLYSDIIFLRVLINIEDMEMEWEVVDKNTGSLYHHFYYNINGENNLVALAVRDEFGKVIKEMESKNILKVGSEYEN